MKSHDVFLGSGDRESFELISKALAMIADEVSARVPENIGRFNALAFISSAKDELMRAFRAQDKYKKIVPRETLNENKLQPEITCDRIESGG